MNRGNNRNRRRKKKVTGRFFAFIAVIVVLGVMIGVFIASRNRTAPAMTYDPTATEQPAENRASDAPGAVDDVWANADENPLEDDTLTAVAASDVVTIESDDLSQNRNLPSEWMNILLLGSDSRDMSKITRTRTDTMMIASVNMETGQIKLTSLQRDMWIDIEAVGKSNKFNALTQYGGPNLAMKTINELLNLNIEKYVMVNFLGMQEAIDALGGIKLDITEAEMNEINKTMISQIRSTNDLSWEDWQRDKEQYRQYQLTTYGKDTQLTGLQAVAYARIRAIGNGDADRTNRQQNVMNALARKVKEDVSITNVATLMKILMEHVKTNYSSGEVIELATRMLISGFDTNIKTMRIPVSGTYVSESRGGTSALFDVKFIENANQLYNFIYNQ